VAALRRTARSPAAAADDAVLRQHDQAQIGEDLGISQMHVSRLLDRALAYLRQKITDTAPPDIGSA
jgi:DNA-binding transcriptional regulator LsrR (DeoR family)